MVMQDLYHQPLHHAVGVGVAAGAGAGARKREVVGFTVAACFITKGYPARPRFNT